MNRFPIATLLGYAWALKRGYDNNTARLLGYGIALAPNIVKNSYRYGMKFDKYRTPVGRGYVNNEDKLLGAKYITFSRWTFAIKDNQICMPNMRNLEWWGLNKFENEVNKFEKSQLVKILAEIDKDFKDLSPEIIENKYQTQYKTFWQFEMDKLRSL